LSSTIADRQASIIGLSLGLIIAASSPASIAIAKNADEISGRCGSPKDMLLTPSTVESPSFSLTRRMARSDSAARSCSALTVRVKQHDSHCRGCRCDGRVSDATGNCQSPLGGIAGYPSYQEPVRLWPTVFFSQRQYPLRLFDSPDTELINTLPSAA
jgi:hypothetical protein